MDYFLAIGNLVPWSRVFLEKLTVTQLTKKFPAFTEPESSLPLSQKPSLDFTITSCSL
jgi:hypothetical protein